MQLLITNDTHNITPVLYAYQKHRCSYENNTLFLSHYNTCTFFTDHENNAYYSIKFSTIDNNSKNISHEHIIQKIYDFDVEKKFIKKIILTLENAFLLTTCGILYVYTYLNKFSKSLSDIKYFMIAENITDIYYGDFNIAYVNTDNHINFHCCSLSAYFKKYYENIISKYQKIHDIVSIKNIYLPMMKYHGFLQIIIENYDNCLYIYTHDSSLDRIHKKIITNVELFHYNASTFIYSSMKYIYTCYCAKELFLNDKVIYVEEEILSVFCIRQRYYYETCNGIFKIADTSSDIKNNINFNRCEIITKFTTKSARNII